MKNTLLSSNGATANAVLFAANVTSQGFNISNIALPQLIFTGDASPANTALDALANNGGPVRTRAPSGGSSALDGGFSTNFFFDARGFARQLDLPTITNFEFGDASDIGAVEAQTAPISPPAAPTVAYSPNAGGNVTFSAFDVSTRRGFVSVNSSGGVAPGNVRVRVSACAATSGFTITNGPIDFLGTAGGTQIITGSLIDLRCTPSASVQNGTLSCTETSNPGSAVQRTWNLSCPAAENLPPALTFNPTAGSTINYATTGTASPIAVTPSGGIGSGQPATTTLSECSITNGGAAFPTTTIAQLSFIGASTTAQNLNLPNCVRQSTAVNATLNCVERRGVLTQVNRSWTLNCPAAAGDPIFGNGFEG